MCAMSAMFFEGLCRVTVRRALAGFVVAADLGFERDGGQLVEVGEVVRMASALARQ